MKVEINKPFIYHCGGEELAKVLLHYGFIHDTISDEYKIVCPFHNDVNPSMIVDLTHGTFFCFGCNEFGDAYKFIELLHPELNSLQCVLKLFKILKSNKLERLDFSNRVKKVKKNEDLYNVACDYYFGLSQIDWERDNSEEVLNAKHYMVKRGFTKKVLNECGAKITYNKQYEIIFPMYDEKDFKGWVCRTTLSDVEKKRKYLYNEGFLRGNTLVGHYVGYDYVFVVEGYMDMLKFIQYGVHNVVAILGWKMSKEQELKLKNAKVEHVVSSLDNDECGVKGTKYLRNIFKVVTRFVYPYDKKDVGEMDKQTFKLSYKKTLKKIAQDRRKP